MRKSLLLACVFAAIAVIFAIIRIVDAYADFQMDSEMKKAIHRNVPKAPPTGQQPYCFPNCDNIVRI